MLRKITDEAGTCWEIARGHESYGAMVILFCEQRGSRVRKFYIYADNAMDADKEIDKLSDAQLCERLAESQPGP